MIGPRRRGAKAYGDVGLALGVAVVVLLAFGVLGCRVAEAPRWEVARVDDGDTLVLSFGTKRTRVRLAGIDAPEKGQPFARESREMLAELMSGGPIGVEKTGEDRYGRTLAVVYVGAVNVNERMVAQGGAWWYERFAPTNRALERLQAGARARPVGLWGEEPAPIPPWEWRASRDRTQGQRTAR